MFRDKVNHLYLIFALPIVEEFEWVNAFFQSSKADPHRSLRGLDLLHCSMKARVYDDRGNEKVLSLVDFGASFVTERNALLRENRNKCRT